MAKEANKKKAEAKAKEDPETAETSGKNEADEPKKEVLPVDALLDNLALLETSVVGKDLAAIKRVLRKNTFIRKTLGLDDFRVVMNLWVPKSRPAYERLNKEMDVASKAKTSKSVKMEVEDLDTTLAKTRLEQVSKMKPREEASVEIEAYLNLFVVSALMKRDLYKEAEASLTELISSLSEADSGPTTEVLLARAYYQKARCFEIRGALDEFRPELLTAHRTACLRLHEFLQTTLINLILRSYCESNLIDQAAKFASKANFPEEVSNNQQVRYLYYMGRIHAIQLDYSIAYAKLNEAGRKAPQHTALGFRIAVLKLSSIVQLLMGDMPERSEFSKPEFELPLLPYFELCKAVRNGSLAEYDHVCKTHASTFANDKVSTLVVRLRNSVIRTGLRRINASYSKISFSDVATRLVLDSPESAELACAKAIRDGVIDATINHEKGEMMSSEVLDIYSTIEPQQAFHKRIQFCLSMHNDAVKAMRYPPDAHKAKHDLIDENVPEAEEIAEALEDEFEDDE
mmetsp:Transcript_14632/g.26235  ORF Transcript_14632/g.26235 Transcript_14632/m.26235 type:complete len:515 (-) Transcript_14632:187-1731(-)